jgi:hypothetical protein
MGWCPDEGRLTRMEKEEKRLWCHASACGRGRRRLGRWVGPRQRQRCLAHLSLMYLLAGLKIVMVQ